jgi:hypothetical protein
MRLLGQLAEKEGAKCRLHPLIHTLLEFNLAQNIGSLKGRDVEKKHPPPNGPAKYPWGQEKIMKSHQIDSYHLYLTNG